MNKIFVEISVASYISRELPTVFHVIDTASREWLGCDYFSTNISSLRDVYFEISKFNIIPNR
ncbi:MAG: hypothetical protein LBC68_08705 [Prevotellaceae bacterium]|nr:hypothetical protein [Prevotellaceae bacterium]